MILNVSLSADPARLLGLKKPPPTSRRWGDDWQANRDSHAILPPTNTVSFPNNLRPMCGPRGGQSLVTTAKYVGPVASRPFWSSWGRLPARLPCQAIESLAAASAGARDFFVLALTGVRGVIISRIFRQPGSRADRGAVARWAQNGGREGRADLR
jgi:hypothetical protein